MTEATFHVGAMRCRTCEWTIRMLLRRVDGVEQVSADHRSETVAVSFDAQRTDAERIGEVLAEAGFPIRFVTVLDTCADDTAGERGGAMSIDLARRVERQRTEAE